MPLLIVGLGVSVLDERVHAPGCWQRSISAYYYTPAHGIFVGALLAIAVCLVCLRGNTDLEDALLNFAGMFAALVALVPTPKPRTACSSAMDAVEDRSKNVGNNVIALLAVGAAALLILAFLALRRHGRQGSLSQTSKIGYGTAVLVGMATVLVFGLARGAFEKGAHYTAAIAMFACILAVVELNAWDFKVEPAGKWVRTSYHAVGIAMGAAVVAFVIAKWARWDYWLLGLETSLIALFAAFWVIQTVHLWTPGLRKRKE